MRRKCKEGWLKTLQEYAEDTESPREFWLWSGLFCLSAALQRKTWLPFMDAKIFPNLYVMIIAPPGWCRKGAPVGFAKRMLQAVELPVYVDSPTKRAFTKKLDTLSRLHAFQYQTKEGVIVTLPQSPLSCVSRELSSFLAQDPKAMIEILTDIYDAADMWEYETANSGADKIAAPYITCLLATTPAWMAANLPQEAIGGGFTRRVVIVSGLERYKSISLPPLPDQRLWRALEEDLCHISGLIGEFKWTDEAFACYDKWYMQLGKRVKEIQDERVQPFLSEVHTIALKTAMCLQVAKSDELVIEEAEMRQSINLLDRVIANAGTAFSSHGRSRSAVDTDRVMVQLKAFSEIEFSNLLKMNYRNTNKAELVEILDDIEGMGLIKRDHDLSTGKIRVRWKGGKDT